MIFSCTDRLLTFGPAGKADLEIHRFQVDRKGSTLPEGSGALGTVQGDKVVADSSLIHPTVGRNMENF